MPRRAPKRRVVCPYCDQEAALVGGTDVYPHREDLAHLRFYVCAPCDARVGVHKGSLEPLGTLACKTLRAARARAHAAFDPLWKSGEMHRREAYAWLSDRLGIPGAACHIGMMDEALCERVVQTARAYSVDDVALWCAFERADVAAHRKRLNDAAGLG